MKFTPFHGAALLSFVIALILFVRITLEHNRFQQTVRKSLMSSEGYDQKFIDLVNHLEDVLATRASFPYQGGTDPMTGRPREVAQFVPAAQPKRIATVKSPRPAAATAAPEPIADRFRLTALIADDFGRYTAIVMNGERSMSVDVGDMVDTRKVFRITAKDITLAGDMGMTTYSLDGGRSEGPK